MCEILNLSFDIFESLSLNSKAVEEMSARIKQTLLFIVIILI